METKPSKARRFAALLFLAVIVTAGAWLTRKVLAPGPIAEGDRVPAISYRAADGTGTPLAVDGERGTVVMLFHSQCGHCHTQLDELDRDLGTLDGIRLVLLTTEDTVPATEAARRWPRLRAGATWGTVGAEAFRERFGTLGTPALFVFRTDGTLAKRFIGETKTGAITALL